MRTSRGIAVAQQTPFNTRPLSPFMGAAVDDVDLSGSIDDATLCAVRAALVDHSLLLFPGQPLQRAQSVCVR